MNRRTGKRGREEEREKLKKEEIKVGRRLEKGADAVDMTKG